MIVTEQVELSAGRLEVTTEAIEAINQSLEAANYTEEDKEDLFLAKAVLLDDSVATTGNNNLYTREIQEQMRPMWIGAPLVYSKKKDGAHKPDPQSRIGWIYAASVETDDNGVTTTRADLVIPKTERTEEIRENLKHPLNTGVSVAIDVTKEACSECGKPVKESCPAHPAAPTLMLEAARCMHVAFVGQSGHPNANVYAVSESADMEDVVTEDAPTITEHDQMLIDEAKAARQPVIEDAVRKARLVQEDIDPDKLRDRLNRFTMEDIRTYAEIQEAAIRKKMPNASKQIAVASTPQSTLPRRESLSEIIKLQAETK